MIKSAALALVGAIAFTNAAQLPNARLEGSPMALAYDAGSPSAKDDGPETLAVYYTPLPPTEVAKYLGFGIAYHMAIIYTDSAGRSFGASARPSNLKGALTPQNAFDALLHLANAEPSGFGTLIADPRNNTLFVKGSGGDFYTQDANRHTYPHRLVMRGHDLSAQWVAITRTYEQIGRLGLTYSPTSQNSNSLAGTALRQAGIALEFSSRTYFVPGAYTLLPRIPPASQPRANAAATS